MLAAYSWQKGRHMHEGAGCNAVRVELLPQWEALHSKGWDLVPAWQVQQEGRHMHHWLPAPAQNWVSSTITCWVTGREACQQPAMCKYMLQEASTIQR